MAELGDTLSRYFSEMTFKQKTALIVGLGVVLRLVFFSGISAADDVFIANAALRVLEDGPYLPTSHYTGRLMLIYPLASIFALFGVGEWQMAIIPMVASLTCLFVAGALARRWFGDGAALWALLAGAIFPLDIALSSRLMPDLPIGAMIAAAVYCAVRATDNTNRSDLWACGAGVLWGMGYLIKIEAAFLLFPLAYLYMSGGIKWRPALMTAAACAVFVVGENIVYWMQTGDILYRLKIIADSTPMVVNAEYSGQQLWVFPKAWFVTFYQFSLHYYLLFAAFIMVIWRRDRRTYLPAIWAGVLLLWLQFGGNPLSDTISFKSHLQRYCLMLAAPSYLLIGYVLSRWQDRAARFVPLFGTAWVLGSLFLTTFNYLGGEREQATKQALAQWPYAKEVPVYMDTSSYTIGRFLYYGTDWAAHFREAYKHDFKTADTVAVNLADTDGYLFLNRGFIDFSHNRYFVSGLSNEAVRENCKMIGRVDNPSYAASYQAAQILGGIMSLVPVAALRDKVSATVDDMLAGQDVVVHACGGLKTDDPGQEG